MAVYMGHYWLHDTYLHIVRTACRARGSNEWVAVATYLIESGQNPWNIGDCHNERVVYVYGRRYERPYFPQKGLYCDSYGLFQVNMIGGLGAGLYPKWWEIVNIFNNVNIACDSLARAEREADRRGYTGHDWLKFIFCEAGFPGWGQLCHDQYPARAEVFRRLITNPDGSWSTIPIYRPGVDPAAPRPNWVCEVDPRVPPTYMGWCPDVAQVSLTMGTAPPGGGTTSPPMGVTQWNVGTPLTLRAIPATDYIFDHWSGDASGSDPIVVLVMNTSKHVTANFRYIPPEPERFTLHMTVDPPGSGRTEPPEGDTLHDAGSMKLCSAFPFDPWEFDYWSGDAMGTAAIVTVLMDRNKSIVAHFKPKEPIPDTPIPTTLEGIRAELRRIEPPWKERV